MPGGQTLSGSFSVESQTSTTGDTLVTIAASNASLNLGDGATNLASFTNGSGLLVLSSAGVAGSLDVTAGFASADATLARGSGTVKLRVNTLGTAVNETVTVAGTTTALTLPAGPYVRVEATGVQLAILNQTLAANFVLDSQTTAGGAKVVRVAISGASVSLTQGGSTLAQVSNGQGVLIVQKAGFAGSFSGAASVSIPGFALSATSLNVAINTGTSAVVDSVTLNGLPSALNLPAGPYVRFEADGVQATIGGQSASGDFAIEQSGTGNAAVTSIAVANLAVQRGGQGIDSGQGAFVVLAGGVAGVVSGTASIAAGGVALGGNLGLRINTTTLAVAQTLTIDGQAIPIQFSGSEIAQGGSPFFAFFGANLSLTVGPFDVSADSLAFSNNGTLTATGADIFLGQGPALTSRSPRTINPAARGLLISNATLGIIKVGSTYAMEATGTVTVLGIPGLAITGAATVTVKFNNTGAPQLIPGTTDTLPDGTRSASGSLTLSVLNQSLAGTFSFDQATTIEGGSVVTTAFSGVSVDLGSTGFVHVTNASGLVLLTPSGLAGQVSASVSLSVPQVSLSAGSFVLQINSTGSPVQETATVGGSTVSVNLPGGPFLRVAATGVNLTVSNQVLSGNFTFEQATASSGDSVVKVAASNVALSLGDGTHSFVSVTNGQGAFILTGTGLAGVLSGSVALNVPQVGLSGVFSVDVNTTALAVNETVTSGGIPVVVNVPLGPYVKVAGTGTQLQVLGQTLSGDFSFSQATVNSAQVVQVTAANASLILGDGTNTIASVNVTSGLLTITASGLTASLTGTASVNLPNVAFSGGFAVAIDTAQGFIHVTGTGVTLNVGPLSLGGTFTLEQSTASDGTKLVRAGVTGLTLKIGTQSTTYVNVTNGQGSFVLTTQGVAAAFSVTATLANLPGVTLGGSPSFTMQVNTTPTAVNETLTVAGQPVTVNVPAGPFVRVEITGASLSFAGGATLSGDFFFDRSLVSANDPITRFAARNVSASLGGVTLQNGQGAFVVESTGLAGFANGTVGASAGGFTAGGTIGLRMNKTGQPVNETIDLNGQSLVIQFADGTDAFQFFGSGSINVANFVEIDGSFSIANNQLGATGANIFLGQGPGVLSDGSINPAARGVLLSNASFGLINPAAGQYALTATGTVQVLGIPGIAISGTATISVNNTGLVLQGQAVATGAATSVFLNFPTTADVATFSGTGLSLSILGQTLTGDFSFSKATDAGQSVLVVGANNVGLTLGDGTNPVVTVTGGSGSLLLANSGLAGSLTASVSLAASTGVTLSGTFGVTVNTTGSAINDSVTVGSTTLPIAVPAGPYLRVSGTGVSLTVAGQTLTGDFAFQRVTNPDGSTSLAIGAANVGLNLLNLVTVTNGSGAFLVTSSGVAGQIGGGVSIAAASFSGSFALQVSTMTSAVNQTITVGGQTIALNLPAGPFVRVDPTATLTIANQVISGQFAFEVATGPSGPVLRVSASNVTFALGDGTTNFLSFSNGAGAFLLTSSGIAGSLSGSVAANIPGVSLSGVWTLQVNSTSQAVAASFAGSGGQTVSINLPAGPYVRITAQAASLTVAGSTITADELDFVKSGPVVSVSGVNFGATLQAGATRIVGVTHADFAFVATSAGLAGAAINAQVVGPNFGGNVTLSGTVSALFNTTATAQSLTVDGQSIAVPAAASGSYLKLELDKDADGTPATFGVLGNTLTADSLVFVKSGQDVSVSGTNLGLLLQAGSTRILQITNASFAFAFSQSGVVGAVANATILGPDFGGNIAISGTVSLSFNTTTQARSLLVAGQTIAVPAATLGGTYFKVEVDSAQLTVFGSVLTADSLVLVKDGANVDVSGTNLGIVLSAGSTRIASVQGANFAFTFTQNGIAGAVSGGNFTGPSTTGVSLSAGGFSVIVNTTSTPQSFAVGSQTIAVPAAPIGGSFVEVVVTGGTLTVAGNALTADQLVLQETGSTVSVSGVNLGLLLQAGSTRVLQVANASFAVTFTQSGVFGAANNATVTGPAIPGLNVTGTVSLEFNTTASAQSVAIGTQSVAIPAASAGTFVRLVVDQASLIVTVAGSDNAITADEFTFQADGSSGVTVAGTNVGFVFAANGTRILSLSGGNFAFTITSAGVFGAITQAAVLGPDLGGTLAISGTVALQINTTASGQSVTVGGNTISLLAGPFVRVEVTSGSLSLLGLNVTATRIAFQKTTDASNLPAVQIEIDNAQFFLGDGSNNLISVVVTTGLLTVNSQGVTATFDASITSNVPGVVFSGAFQVAVDTTNAAARYVRVESKGPISLSVAGQTLTAGFSLEQVSAQDGSKLVRVAVSGLSLQIVSGGSALVNVSDGSGAFLLNSQGIAGRFSVTADVTLPGVAVTVATTDIELNTASTAASDALTIDGETFNLSLPAGPFVRLDAIGAQVTIGSTVLSGDFTFDQQSGVSRFAASNDSLTFSGDGLKNGVGAFVIMPSGVAGTISGDVSANGGGFSVGGSIGLRINTTTSVVNQSITVNGQVIVVAFAANEVATDATHPFFALFGSGTIQIGDFVTIEGNVSFSSNGTLSASNVVVFLGQGPALLSSDVTAINPAARGILITGATVGALRVGIGPTYTYAAMASGTVQVLGVPGVTFTGTASVAFNNTGAIQTIPGGLGTVADGTRTFSGSLTLAALGQSLSGTFGFDEKADSSGDKVTTVSFQGVTLDLGNGLVHVANGQGLFVLTSAGLAGTATATISSTAASFGGTFGIAINTTPSAVTETVNSLTIAVPAGPYIRVSGTGVSLALPGPSGTSPASLKGDFSLESLGTGPTSMVRIAAANVTVALGDSGGGPDFVDVSGGEAFFLVSSAGVAGTLSGSVTTSVPNVAFGGTFAVTVNGTGVAVHQQFTVGLKDVLIDLPAGVYTKVAAKGVTLSVLGQTLTGDFTFEQSSGTTTGNVAAKFVRVTFANVGLSLGDPASPAISVSNGRGAFLLTKQGATTALAGVASASVAITPSAGVAFTGNFSLAINTGIAPVVDQLTDADGNPVSLNLPAGTFLQVGGTGLSLSVLGQTLTGDFTFSMQTLADSSQVITVAANNVALSLTDGTNPILTLKGSGALILSSSGLAGTVTATVDATHTSSQFQASGTFTIQVNDTSAAVSQLIPVGGSNVVLNVPAGPFVQVSGTGVVLSISGQSISGDFVFQKATTSAGSQVVQVAASNVSATLGTSTVGLVFTSGSGLFLFNASGLAGTASGQASLVGVPGVTLQAALILDFNNTGSPVNATLGGQTIAFTSGNFARVDGSATLNLANFVAISGNFSFAQAKDSLNAPVVGVGATGVSALLGVPGSVGLSLSNGTLGLIVYPASGTYALNASGDVAILGVSGVTASGTIRVRVNTTGRQNLNESVLVGGVSVPVVFGPGEGNIAFFEADAITLVTPVASLSGKFVFIKDGSTNEIQAAGTGISFLIGSQSLGVQVTGATFGLLLEPDRSYAFDASGTAAVLGIPDLTFVGSLHAQKNTTGANVDRTIAVGGTTVHLVIAAGLSRFGADNVTLDTPAGNVTGSFAIEQSTAGPDGIVGTADDASEILVGATNVNLSVGNTSTGPGVSVNGAQLVLLITAAGYAFAASGSAALVGVPGVSISGTVGVQRNTVKKNGQPVPVARTITVGGITQTLDLDAGISQFGGQDISINVLGQTLTGNFAFSSQNGTVTVSASNVGLVLGDGSNPIITASNGSGSFTFSPQGIVGSASRPRSRSTSRACSSPARSRSTSTPRPRPSSSGSMAPRSASRSPARRSPATSRSSRRPRPPGRRSSASARRISASRSARAGRPSSTSPTGKARCSSMRPGSPPA